jgi:hypothetical protein
MKLSTEYDYAFKVLACAQVGLQTTLRELSTGKEKVFFQAGAAFTSDEAVASMQKHMDSLTDDLCSSWFKQRERKKDKKGQ